MVHCKMDLMLNFIPDLQLGSLLPPQRGLEDKFGGLPWGLRTDLWPMCRHCGRPQSLLAQLSHDDQRLDLGRDGRVLFVFQCCHPPWKRDPRECESWSSAAGANACLI